MRRFIGSLAVVVFVIWIATPAVGIVWNVAFDGDPAAGDPVSEGDDRIRDMREEIRYRAEVEHWWANDPDGENNDNGLHRLGSSRCYMTTAAPTELADSHTAITAGNLADYDNTTETSMSGEPDLDQPSTNSAGNAEDDVGHGRCWIDTDGADGVDGTADDNKMWIYVGNSGWEAVDAAARIDGDDEILAGAYNLIYNGSFEAVDGTGDETVTGACAALGTSPCPAGWGGSNIGLDYTDPTTDINYGEGFHLDATASAGNGEVTQILESLAANQTYKVIARAMDDGTTVCTLDTDGETGVAFAPDSTTTNLWETLSGTFTTGAAFEDVTVQLITVTNGQECLWDHVAVYRIDDVDTDRDEISQPGAYKVRAERAAGAGDIDPCDSAIAGAGSCNAAATGLSVSVTPASPGSLVTVSVHVQTSSTLDTNDCFLRLYDATNAVTLGSAFSDRQYIGEQTIQHTIVNPTVGTTLVLNADVWAVPVNQCDFEDDTESYIEAVVIPTR